MISLWVPGRPAPKGNKKFFRGMPVEPSKYWPAWHDAIWYTAKADGQTVPKSAPLRVDLVFYFAFPATSFDKDGGVKSTAELYYRPRPDLDNLTKGVLDSLEDAGTIPHDADVVEVRAKKMRDTDTGVQIEIRVLEPLTAQNEEMVVHRETVTYEKTLRHLQRRAQRLLEALKKNGVRKCSEDSTTGSGNEN